jgi:DNA-binding response OmpR family regulator
MHPEPSVLATAPDGRRSTRSPGSGPRKLDQTGSLRRMRVLIVEDHEDTREMFAWAMRAGGWVVRSVLSGSDVLDAAVAFEPDAIVLDLALPVLSGLDVLVQLRDDARTKQVPVVVCTAYGSPRTRAQARIAGCAEFVQKPIDPDALRELLEHLPLRAPR